MNNFARHPDDRTWIMQSCFHNNLLRCLALAWLSSTLFPCKTDRGPKQVKRTKRFITRQSCFPASIFTISNAGSKLIHRTTFPAIFLVFRPLPLQRYRILFPPPILQTLRCIFCLHTLFPSHLIPRPIHPVDA